MRGLRPARRFRRHPLPWILLVAFALNVLALFIPFLEMRRGFSSDPYSLPRSVALLWEKGLYVLAAVIVLFSVCFPFLKLGVMAGIVFGCVHPRRRRPWLAFVERFGKWSMLDVFLVCLMIALANDQLLIDAEPRVGILLFTLAIVLAMGCSAWMRRTLVREAPLAPLPRRSWALLVGGQVLILLLVLAVVSVPFLEIDDWLLVDRPVSIVDAIVGLWTTGARTLAGVVALFLGALPVAACAVSLAVLVRLRRGRSTDGLRRWLTALGHWAMLDVFALALGIFLVEGREFVRTDLAWGAFLLGLLLALYWPVSAVYQRRLAS